MPPGVRARSPAPPRHGGRRGAAGAPAHASSPPSRSNASMLRPDPLPVVAVERDQHHRAAVALDQARGDDPDHPGVPALAGQHVRRRALRAAAICASASKRMRVSTCLRSRLARSSSPAISVRALRVLGQDQLEPGVGAVQASRRVQPRRQRRSRPSARSPCPASTRDTAISARSPGLAVPASARRPRRTSARFSPTSGTTSAIVASATRSRSSRSRSPSARTRAGGSAQRLRQLVGDRRRAQLRAGIAAERRVHDRRVAAAPRRRAVRGGR